MFEVDEKSSFDLDIELVDKNGNPLSPIDAIEWWVGKPREDTPIIAKQIETPATSLTITVPAIANICTTDRDEDRFVIVRVESGTRVRHQQYDYVVKNLNLVPYPV